MAGAEAGDRGKLAGLRSRPDLNGRRVEVRGTAAGKDGAPRVAVRLLFGAGAGTVLKVKAWGCGLLGRRGGAEPRREWKGEGGEEPSPAPRMEMEG